MIVCHCRAVAASEVRAAVESGARDVEEVADACGAGAECMGCHTRITALLHTMEQRLVLQDAS
jgi:bacterioferritin-associated ferredoxin